jgi:DNA-binding response OmpR family regulator
MKKKILIIDDDDDILRSFQVILENKGFNILTAKEGVSGYELLVKENPDALILDIMMTSNLEGYNLLHQIKQNKEFSQLPIIIMTGMRDQMGVNLYSAVEDNELFPNVRFQDKPADPNEIADILNEMLK